MFDLEMIKNLYSRLRRPRSCWTQAVGRPLTRTEKILYAHLWHRQMLPKPMIEKKLCDFAPRSRCYADATAQWPLYSLVQPVAIKLPFLLRVHCDHLIVAKDILAKPTVVRAVKDKQRSGRISLLLCP
jgi:aconitate hydratase